MKKTLITLMLLLGITTACNPAHAEIWESLSTDQQEAVIQHIRKNAPSRDCNEAIDKHFSGDKERMKKIVWRESRNNPAAANPRSSARGCVQALAQHDWRYYEVGCTPAQKLTPDCNIKVGDHLYRQAGWSPWRLTNY